MRSSTSISAIQWSSFIVSVEERFGISLPPAAATMNQSVASLEQAIASQLEALSRPMKSRTIYEELLQELQLELDIEIGAVNSAMILRDLPRRR